MKKVLAIIASPRKLGNSEILAKEIARNIPEDHELKLLRLSDFNLMPCRGCYICLFSEEGCPLPDDLGVIADAMQSADAFIVTAPTYFLGPNACLKRFMDRGIALYRHGERIWGKPAVGVGIAGIPGKEGYTLLGVESFLKILLAEIKGVEMVYGALPGEIFLNDATQARAAALGRSLFGDPLPNTNPTCPQCGGATFRFLGGDQVRCMLCSNAGTITMEGDTPRMEIQRGEHQFFLSKKDALEHRDWLVGMKSRFMEQKGRLKKIVVDYRGDGDWITPPKGDSSDSE